MICVQATRDFGYLSKLLGAQVTILKKPELKWFVVTHNGERSGCFLLILMPGGPELHVHLTMSGKPALEAFKAMLNLCQQNRFIRVRARAPRSNRAARYMACAAGFKRIGESAANVAYEWRAQYADL